MCCSFRSSKSNIGRRAKPKTTDNGEASTSFSCVTRGSLLGIAKCQPPRLIGCFRITPAQCARSLVLVLARIGSKVTDETISHCPFPLHRQPAQRALLGLYLHIRRSLTTFSNSARDLDIDEKSCHWDRCLEGKGVEDGRARQDARRDGRADEACFSDYCKNRHAVVSMEYTDANCQQLTFQNSALILVRTDIDIICLTLLPREEKWEMEDAEANRG